MEPTLMGVQWWCSDEGDQWRVPLSHLLLQHYVNIKNRTDCDISLQMVQHFFILICNQLPRSILKKDFSSKIGRLNRDTWQACVCKTWLLLQSDLS